VEALAIRRRDRARPAVAGAGYAFDTVGAVLAPDLPFRVSLFTFLGELLLALWPLAAGRRLRAVDRARVTAARLAR
jgi:hypothetical protein